MRRLPRLGLALASLLTACDGGRYAVTVGFDPPGLAEDAQAVELAVVASCGAQAPGAPAVGSLQTLTLRRMGEAAALGDLEPGTYGLYGVARTGACEVAAAGCATVEVEAGGSGTLRVVLEPTTGPACEGVCADGVCERGDAGTPEDAGPGDCPGSCDDADACTDDACVGSECVHTTRDGDGDGHGDDACPSVGGVPNDDCDDAVATTYEGATELCNGADDDCDEATDEGFDCVPGATEACINCGPGQRQCTAACAFGPCLPTPASEDVALWAFEAEPSATAITDRTGAHDGSVSDATWVDGPLLCGQAMELDGAGFAEVPNAADFDIDAGSLSIWVRFDVDDVELGIFSRDESGQDTDGHFSVYRNATTNAIHARLQTMTASIARCTAAAVASGAWHSVVVRWGPPDLELIVDGVVATGCSVEPHTAGTSGNLNPVVIGASLITSMPASSEGATGLFDGALDHAVLSTGRADPDSPEVTGFVLVDADADVSLGPLIDGAVIEADALPALNFYAITDPGDVGSVIVELDGVSNGTQNIAPYSHEDSDGDYAPVPLAPGEHTLRATAYTGADAGGNAGTARTVTFTVR